MKALIHVQHLLGTGHVVRAAAVGRELAARGVAVTLVTGNRLPPTLDTGDLAVAALPPARAADATFSTLVDEEGRPVDEAWRERRAERLAAIYREVEPDILVTETFPFGRRQFAFELFPLIASARAAVPPPLVAASVRDILVRKEDLAKERWMADTARANFDVVLVHSDPALVRLADSFPFAGRIADLVRYTGFVYAPSEAEPPAGDGDGEVIASCGGGPVGTRLLEAAAGASEAPTLAGYRWRFLVARDHPALATGRLRTGTNPRTVVEPPRRDFPRLLQRAALSISQAGYNTALDVLAAGVPAVFVPFAEEGETEQLQRAAVLAGRGLAVVVEEEALTPQILAEAAWRALARHPPRIDVRTDGAAASADILIGEARRRRYH